MLNFCKDSKNNIKINVFFDFSVRGFVLFTRKDNIVFNPCQVFFIKISIIKKKKHQLISIKNESNNSYSRFVK